MASVHSRASSPSEHRYLGELVSSLGAQNGIRKFSEFDQQIEIASHPAFDIKNPAPITQLREIYARAIFSGREGFIGTITLLYVEGKHRQQGHGRELLNMIETFAAAKSLVTIFAPTSTEECSELYEHCGYVQDRPGRRNGRRRSDGSEHEDRVYRKDFP